MSGTARGIGGFLEGFAGGAMTRQSLDRQKKFDDALEKLTPAGDSTSTGDPQPRSIGPFSFISGVFGGGGKAASAEPAQITPAQASPVATTALPDVKPYRTGDPVWGGAGYQKALLNAIAGGESGGQYDVRYTPKGGAKFSGFDQHPGIYEQGPEGRSSAAGRYQFTKSTWDDYGGGSFAPEMQDQRAWLLASDRYRRSTGQDLASELQKNGLTPGVLTTLAPTWAAFKSNHGRHIATYNDSLTRYSTQAEPAAQAGGASDNPLLKGL